MKILIPLFKMKIIFVRQEFFYGRMRRVLYSCMCSSLYKAIFKFRWVFKPSVAVEDYAYTLVSFLHAWTHVYCILSTCMITGLRSTAVEDSAGAGDCAGFSCRWGLAGKSEQTKPTPLLPNPPFLPFFLWCDLLLTVSHHPSSDSTIPLTPSKCYSTIHEL